MVFLLEHTVMLLLITSVKVRSTRTYMCEISSILLKFCARFWQISSKMFVIPPQISSILLNEESGNPVLRRLWFENNFGSLLSEVSEVHFSVFVSFFVAPKYELLSSVRLLIFLCLSVKVTCFFFFVFMSVPYCNALYAFSGNCFCVGLSFSSDCWVKRKKICKNQWSIKVVYLLKTLSYF